MVFTNKHVIVAMIVAPILAVIAYLGVDHIVSETPHAAKEGGTYKLVAKSNCRYESGKCTLKNGEVSIDITAKATGQNQTLFTLTTDIPMEGARLGLGKAGEEPATTLALSASDTTATEWVGNVEQADIKTMNFQLVVKIKDALYYGESGMVFTDFATGFSQSNIN